MGAVILSDPVLEVVRRELRRLSDVNVELDALRMALKQEVVKREVIEGEKADAARRRVNKAGTKALRARRDKVNGDTEVGASVPDTSEEIEPV